MHSLQSLQKRLRTALLITSQPNLRYLSGFTGSSGILVITPKQAWFFTDPRYTEVASKQLHSNVKLIELDKKDPEAFKNFLKKKGISKITFESNQVTLEEYGVLKEKLGHLIYISKENLISPLRMIKTEEEIKLIQKASRITAKVFRDLKKELQPRTTEQDLAQKIKELIYKNGGDKEAFDPIVAFGKNTAIPHHQPDKTRLKKHDIIQLDFGTEVEGYKSDMSRVIFIGKPKEELKHIYEEVLNMQQSAIKKIKPNMQAKTLAKKYLSQTYSENKDPLISHGLGHGVGLDIHELPNLKENSEDRLKENQIITIEPGIYVNELGGVRIEDTILITKEGAKILTNAPKSLRANTIEI